MVYLMLFSLFLAGPAIDDVYTMFRKGEFHMPPRYFHPQLDAIDPHIFIATAQEGEYLKAVTYWHSKETNTCSYYMGVYYLPNPQKRDFSGMPVRYVRGEGYFLFADGTRLYPELPPDTHRIGSSAKWYYVRWRRVHKNYYLISLFRRYEETTVREELMTAKDGTDLTPILGESSREKDLSGYSAMLSTHEPYLSRREKVDGEERYFRIPLSVVKEKDLPPDFPRGLVRWLP